MNDEAKRKLLRMIPHAVYLITSQAGSKTAAATITWITQTSFEPPLIVAALKRDSQTYQVVREAQSFVLNFLGAAQKDLAQKFFKHVEPEGGKLAGEPFKPSPLLKFPMFPQMAGYLECRATAFVDRGDHSIVVAEVVATELGSAPGPLLLSTTGWQYGG